MDGRQARTETKNKQAQNKPVNARKKKSRVFIQDENKRPKKRRLRALKRKLQTKARKQNAKKAGKATAERSERIENGRKRHKHGKTGANPPRTAQRQRRRKSATIRKINISRKVIRRRKLPLFA